MRALIIFIAWFSIAPSLMVYHVYHRTNTSSYPDKGAYLKEFGIQPSKREGMSSHTIGEQQCSIKS